MKIRFTVLVLSYAMSLVMFLEHMDVTVQQSARKGELMEEMFIKDLEKIAQSEGFDISIHIIENSACMDFYKMYPIDWTD